MAIILLGGCGNKPIEEEPEPDPVEINEPVTAPDPEPEPEPEPELPYTSILTGVGAEEENLIRPVVVMVENSPNARPQSGLHMADIVYEVLAEGSITRFIAVYQSQSPDLIGPVRSIRPYFIRIGDSLDAIIVHAGWSPEAQRMLTTSRRASMNFLLADHVYSWRSSERRAPHNLYTSMEKIREGAEKKQYRDEAQEFDLKFVDADAELLGESAKQVKVNYIQGYNVVYEYDEENEYYSRIMAGEPHLDKETETPLIAHNIIILKTRHQVLDNEGRRAVDVEGPGDGYLVRKGTLQEIRWDGTDGFIRTYVDDEEQALVPGQTWINIIPTSSSIEYE